MFAHVLVGVPDDDAAACDALALALGDELAPRSTGVGAGGERQDEPAALLDRRGGAGRPRRLVDGQRDEHAAQRFWRSVTDALAGEGDGSVGRPGAGSQAPSNVDDRDRQRRQANYAASKAGLLGLTKTLAREAALAVSKSGKDDRIGLTSTP